MTGTKEAEISLGVLRIADAQIDGRATFKNLRHEIPNFVDLDAADLAISRTPDGEPMWHQIVRNIQSHHATDGNFIRMGYLKHIPKIGYEITDAGRRFLRARGFRNDEPFSLTRTI